MHLVLDNTDGLFIIIIGSLCNSGHFSENFSLTNSTCLWYEISSEGSAFT